MFISSEKGKIDLMEVLGWKNCYRVMFDMKVLAIADNEEEARECSVAYCGNKIQKLW